MVDAMLRHMYDLPIVWLRYYMKELKDPVTGAYNRNAMHYKSMGLSYGDSDITSMFMEEMQEAISRFLELDLAVDMVCTSDMLLDISLSSNTVYSTTFPIYAASSTRPFVLTTPI